MDDVVPAMAAAGGGTTAGPNANPHHVPNRQLVAAGMYRTQIRRRLEDGDEVAHLCLTGCHGS